VDVVMISWMCSKSRCERGGFQQRICPLC
jgi:hypothetical protein